VRSRVKRELPGLNSAPVKVRPHRYLAPQRRLDRPRRACPL
jgi:hypothetical protein